MAWGQLDEADPCDRFTQQSQRVAWGQLDEADPCDRFNRFKKEGPQPAATMLQRKNEQSELQDACVAFSFDEAAIHRPYRQVCSTILDGVLVQMRHGQVVLVSEVKVMKPLEQWDTGNSQYWVYPTLYDNEPKIVPRDAL